MADVGDLVPLSIQVRDANGVLTNAGNVALTLTLPDGTLVSPAVANPPLSVGNYTAQYVSTQIGRHLIRWVTVTPQAAFSDTFDARDVASRSIMSLAEAKAHLNMTATKDDEELRQMIEAVTSVIERFRNEAVVQRVIVERNVMGYGNRLVLAKRPVVSVSTIYDWLNNPQNVTQWTLDPDNGTLTNYRFRWYNGREMTVTYVAGYQEVPAHYILAAKIILAHMWTTQRIQNIGQQVTLGSRSKPEELINTPTGIGYSIPMRAVELLGGRPSLVV